MNISFNAPSFGGKYRLSSIDEADQVECLKLFCNDVGIKKPEITKPKGSPSYVAKIKPKFDKKFEMICDLQGIEYKKLDVKA